MHTPAELHTPDWQSIAPLPVVHPVCPFARPHSLLVPHTPLAHTSVPAPTLHLPFSVGLACAESVGIGDPFESLAVHMLLDSSHQLPVGQSASTLQPPAGSHLPAVLHAPDWQSVGPLATVHPDCPFARPHSLFVPHTPLTHTSIAAAVEHIPLRVGFV
jgi:hypothetical protein